MELAAAAFAVSAALGSVALGALNLGSNNIQDPVALRNILRANGLGIVADHIPG